MTDHERAFIKRVVARSAGLSRVALGQLCTQLREAWINRTLQNAVARVVEEKRVKVHDSI